MTIETGTRRMGLYARVSSDDQAERGTIATQLAELDRWLANHPDVTLIERYLDDGVSGMIPLGERASGSRLLTDAATGRFSELLVYRHDRLGRELVDLAIVRRQLDALGIALTSVVEGQTDLLVYDIQSAVAAHVRREFLRSSADGMNRAARDGRYCGGIVPYGYVVEGERQTARAVPDEALVVANLSAADVIRLIYRRLALDRRTCRQIADELNLLGVPTHYARTGRGVRGRRTRGLWRAGRIRNLVGNPVYAGTNPYGRRSRKPGREVIEGPGIALVDQLTWDGAQAALAANRVIPKNATRTYLLRGCLTCASCGSQVCRDQGSDGDMVVPLRRQASRPGTRRGSLPESADPGPLARGAGLGRRRAGPAQPGARARRSRRECGAGRCAGRY